MAIKSGLSADSQQAIAVLLVTLTIVTGCGFTPPDAPTPSPTGQTSPMANTQISDLTPARGASTPAFSPLPSMDRPAPSRTPLPIAPPTASPVTVHPPTPASLPPIKHVVVLVQENHTYDNYFGTFPGGNGVTLQQVPRCTAYVTPSGAPCQFVEEDLSDYWKLARTYALSDSFFTETNGPSYPNHFYLFAANSPFLGDPVQTECPKRCVDWPSLFSLLSDAGQSWQVYVGEGGFDYSFALRSLYDQRQQHPRRPTSRLLADLATQPLAAVTFVYPSFKDSEHPTTDTQKGTDIRDGQKWVTRVVDAIEASPSANDTLILVTWDDWGGVYDHVRSPVAEFLHDADGNLSFRYGPRVPLIVIGPMVKHGYVSHALASQLSIARSIERIFGLPSLNRRDQAAWDLSDVLVNAPDAPPADPPRIPLGVNLIRTAYPDPFPGATPVGGGFGRSDGWTALRLTPEDGEDCATRHGPLCSFHLTSATGTTKALHYESYDLVGGAGDTYEFAGWSSSRGAEGSAYHLAAIVYDGQGQQVVKQVAGDRVGMTDYLTAAFAAGTHDWQEARLRFTTTGPYGRIGLIASYNGPAGQVWYDDLSLVRLSGPNG